MSPLTKNYGIPALNFEVGILTPREIQIIERLLLPSKNIAYDLNISEHTVTNHVSNIKIKTGLLDKYQMVYFGTKKGLIN